MRHFGTKQKFRHTRLGDDGERYVVWASNGSKISGGEEFGEDEIRVGTPKHVALIRDQLWTPNVLADEGEEDMLDVYFDDQAVRTSLFLSLWNDTPVETDGLTDLTGEVTGTGYARITVTRGTDWTAPVAATGTDMTTKQFSAGGTWSSATYLVVSTSSDNTGLLIAYNALSTTRTLVASDTLDIDLNITLE